MNKFHIALLNIVDGLNIDSSTIAKIVGAHDAGVEEAIAEARKTGPRGPTEKTAARCALLRPAFLDLIAGNPEGVTKADLMAAAEDSGIARDERWVYTDIAVVAGELKAAGLITETHVGRKVLYRGPAASTETPASTETTEPAPADDGVDTSIVND